MPGKTESLNVAAAAAICFFEKVRQDKLAAATGIGTK
jgi:TrmH family RNA methyltransferase